MKLLHVRIRGLLGVYSGSHVKDINIDFTKCKNKITLIIGGNGSGKSTLLSVLHPLPDSQSYYIPKEEGIKELSYIHNGIIYNMSILYPINKYGERTTTKAYMQKIVDGCSIELNPNGNVTSYKDCLYTELKLDANFAALTKLAIDDKGIVTKTPSERVKFVASIVKETEVYTNIYKALNKRSSVFKSMINNLVSKIDSIGSQDNIEHTLNSVNMRIDQLSKHRDICIKNLSAAEAMVQQLDMDGKIQTQYNDLYTQLQSTKDQIDTVNLFISKYMVHPYDIYIKDKNSCSENFSIFEKDIVRLEGDLDNIKNNLQNMLIEREEDSKILLSKTNRMNSLRSQYNFEEMFKQLRATKQRISSFKELLKDLGLSEDTTLTKDEFILGLSTLKDIKGQIDTFRSFSYNDNIEAAIDYINNTSSLIDELSSIDERMDDLNELILHCKEDISYYNGLLNRGSILSQRPEKCKIDNCPFISDALDAMEKEPEKRLQKTNTNLTKCNIELKELESRREYLNNILNITQSLNNILRMIFNNKFILNKLPNGNIFTDTPLFLDKLKSGSPFNEINNLYNYVDRANLFEQYRIDKESLIRLESEYEIYQNRNSIIEEINSDINNLQKKLDNTLGEIEKANAEILRIGKELQEKRDLATIVGSMINNYTTLERLNSTKDYLEESIHSIAANMEAIEQAVKDINNINSEIVNIDNMLDPLKGDRDSLKFSIEKLREYNEELVTFTTKYNKIEVIKRYTNPTKEGIQKLFIDMYMGQTLAIANQLLSMFFDGRMRLLDYQIDDNQFRIPCANLESSINNDDVSSCSEGEKSMLAMILSFALLQQSSTLYNILRLDEIDGTLDQSNRGMFMQVLSIIIDELGIDNCLMISHASETSLSDVDIICLNMQDLNIPKGNIIYSTAV